MRSPCAGREFNYRPVQGNTVMAAHAIAPSAAITRPAFVRCQRGGKITAAQKEAFMKEKLAQLKERALSQITASEGLDKLNDIRVAFLGNLRICSSP